MAMFSTVTDYQCRNIRKIADYNMLVLKSSGYVLAQGVLAVYIMLVDKGHAIEK